MRYKERSTINTYPWIIATASSRRIRIFKIIEVKAKIRILLFRTSLSKEIRRCPAIILAESRIESVKGRIRLLIVSIKTIKGHKIKGVFKGTRCLSILKEVKIQPLNIIAVQNGKENLKEIERWLVGVKIKGNKEKRFENLTSIKNLIKIIKFLKKDFFKLLAMSIWIYFNNILLQ